MSRVVMRPILLVAGLGLLVSLAPPGVAAASRHEVERAERLAQEGEPAAQVAWGIMHENGDGVPANATEASKWYRLAAEQGDAEGAFRLGFLYARGEGLPRNAEKAAEWYERAAKQGHALAQVALGWIWFNGDGIGRDVAKATHWFTQAAESGDANAQYTLGVILSGAYDDVPVDLPAAARWFERAAQQGMATAQFRYGRMLAQGEGVAPDPEAAYFWLTVAVARLPAGSFQRDAETARALVAERLGAAARRAIEQRAATWQP